MGKLVEGVQLQVMVGPVVATPAPQFVVEALTEINIKVQTSNPIKDFQPSTYELVFSVSAKSPLHTVFLLTGGSVPPILRVLLIAHINGSKEVLMDGVMVTHQVTPGGPHGNATVTVTCEDLSSVMNRIEFTGLPYPAMTREARVGVIILKYAFLGIIPVVVPTLFTDLQTPVDKYPSHQGTDRSYLWQMAKEVGSTFYVQPGPKPGMNIAYWGPPVKVGPVQPALNVEMGPFTNVESMNFSFNPEDSILPVVIIHEPKTKLSVEIPVPSISLLNPPLGLIPGAPKVVKKLEETAPYPAPRAIQKGLSEKASTADIVTATGSLSVLRYGRILKARQLVGVRGAGIAFNGLYYVKDVSHSIKKGEYRQDFTLVRNGIVSTVPRVPA